MERGPGRPRGDSDLIRVLSPMSRQERLAFMVRYVKAMKKAGKLLSREKREEEKALRRRKHYLRKKARKEMNSMDYEGAPFCNVEQVGMPGMICRWPSPKIKWSIVSVLPGFAAERFKQACAEAFQAWADVCGIQPEYTAVARDANVLIGVGFIDGPSGTLAWSEMPCGRVGRALVQRYDTGDRWVISIKPIAGRIDLLRVLIHEIGHVIGIPHLDAGNIMQPSFSWGISALQSGDIAEAVRRYGDPQPRPNPIPVPGGDTDMKPLLDNITVILASLARVTPTQLDDKLVALFAQLAQQEWFIKFLEGLFDKLQSGEINEAQFLAAIKAEVEGTKAA